MADQTELKLRTLKPADNIPYSLLLLADETKEGIDTYIHQAVIYVLEHGDEMIAVCTTVMISERVMEIKKHCSAGRVSKQGDRIPVPAGYY